MGNLITGCCSDQYIEKKDEIVTVLDPKLTYDPKRKQADEQKLNIEAETMNSAVT